MNGKSILAVLTAAGTLSGPVVAQPEGRRGGRDGSRFEAMADYVGLSPAQREQWKTLREAHRKEVEPLRAEGRDLHEKLRAVLEADNPDPAAVGAAMVALKQHREKMKASHEALLGRMKGQLTPAQQEKLAAFEAASKAQRRPHGGPRHRGPFPDEG